MEKFKEFTDRATGINPFLPAAVARRPLAVALAALWLPLAALLGALCLVALELVDAVPLCPAAVAGPAGSALARAVLLLAAWAPGVQTKPFPARPGRQTIETAGAPVGDHPRFSATGLPPIESVAGAAAGTAPGAGLVVLAPLQSPLDPFVLRAAGRRRLAFGFPPLNATAGGRAAAVEPLVFGSCTKAARHIMFVAAPARGATAPARDAAPPCALGGAAAAAARHGGAALVFFPEGATSNGRGVLRCAPFTLALPAEPHRSVVATVVAPTYTAAGHVLPAPCAPLRFALGGLTLRRNPGAGSGGLVHVAAARPSVDFAAAAGQMAGQLNAAATQEALASAASFNRFTDAPCRAMATADAAAKARFAALWAQAQSIEGATAVRGQS